MRNKRQILQALKYIYTPMYIYNFRASHISVATVLVMGNRSSSSTIPEGIVSEREADHIFLKKTYIRTFSKLMNLHYVSDVQ